MKSNAARKTASKPRTQAKTVAKRAPSRALVPVVYAEPPKNMLELIDRAARDPGTNVSNLERLLALQKEHQGAEARIAYYNALRELKPKLPVIERNGEIVIHEKGKEKTPQNVIQSTPYALWEDIDEAITPFLNDAGFVLSFRTGSTGTKDDPRVVVTTILTHSSGHSEESEITLPLDTSGSKNNVQGVGSSLSYGKRYGTIFLLNIRTKGNDDDGNAAGGNGQFITKDQFETLNDLIVRSGANETAFCKHMGVDAVEHIRREEFSNAVTALNTKLHRSQQQSA